MAGRNQSEEKEHGGVRVWELYCKLRLVMLGEKGRDGAVLCWAVKWCCCLLVNDVMLMATWR
jgi:hypothetical protein